MVLLIDNYDSFVHNLARYVRELGADTEVARNDAVTIDQITALAPSHIILSPGPCTPREAGISTEVVRRFGATTPILGVCLGHQAIGVAYGGEVVRAARPVHGKTSHITHRGSGIFEGLPSPFEAARYHSLVISRPSLPASLRVTAFSDDGAIMAVEHESHPVFGVQFHPESAASEYGYSILYRFLNPVTATDADHIPTGADGRDSTHRGNGRGAESWAERQAQTTSAFIPRLPGRG